MKYWKIIWNLKMIFFRNLKDTERKVGNMDKVDKKRISHTYKEIETSEILSNIENANDLLNKYTLGRFKPIRNK